MDSGFHKMLDVLSHIYPYVAGIFITMVAVVRLWWHNRQETRRRIATLEIMAERMASQDDLQACRDEVRHVDEQNLEKIYNEMKENNRDNAQQHNDILNQSIGLHK